MPIRKTAVMLAGTNKVVLIDTIDHEGGLWLVPHWQVAPSEGWKSPTRMVRLDTLKHQTARDDYRADFFLNEPMPISVLDGRTENGYEVVDAPEIRLSAGSKGN